MYRMNGRKEAYRNREELPSENVDKSEQWRSYWEQKQQQRKKRLHSYVALIFFTALFGFVNISLRLDLRKPPQERFYQGLSVWLTRAAQATRANWSSWSFWKSGESEVDRPTAVRQEQVLSEPKPNNKDLQVLVGKNLTNIDLDSSTWGDFKQLTGSDGGLEVLSFAKAQVYLIRRKDDNAVVYASNKKP